MWVTQGSSVLPHLMELLPRDSECSSQSLKAGTWLVQSDATEDPACQNWRSNVLQLRPGTTKQIKYFLKRVSSKSSQKFIFLWKRKHKRILQLHSNNKIMSFPIYENICFKNNKPFPLEKSSVGELIPRVWTAAFLTALSHCISQGLGCSYVDIRHGGVYFHHRTRACVLRFGPLGNRLLFPSLA